jgi:peptide chain release factor 2
VSFGGIFDVDRKTKRLEEIETQSQNPALWNNHQELQKINQEKALLRKSVDDYQSLARQSEDADVMVEMIKESGDEELFLELKSSLHRMENLIGDLELKSLLSGELDGKNCFLSIHSGAGGTEACDWAEMLYRMYQRYAEAKGHALEVMSINFGDEAGLKSVTVNIRGPYAFGYLKAETGVHRLVRISPYDSNARRHTSFASVMVWPEVDEDIKIEIRDEDLRVDTYRSSGAGGQHVNRTDSAVRLTHIPTGIVVACQNERSQHSNKDRAMKMLKAALYELELERLKQEKEAITSQKKANEWGSQIRSYVLHPYQLVKDHRTQWESGTPVKVLDGDLDQVIEAYLKTQVRPSTQ